MSRCLRILMISAFLAKPASAATVSVDVGPGFSFNPAAITIAVGDTVTWNFRSPNHTTTSDATTGVDAWDSGVIASGGSFSHTFVNTGNHPYYCAIHSFPGGSMMNGVVTVTAPAPAPVVTGVSPTSGESVGGLTVTLTGADFVNDCVASFGGVNSPLTTFSSSTTLQAITPGHAPGIVDVRISCSTGTSVLPAAFTFLLVPPPPPQPPSIPTLSTLMIVLLAISLLLVGSRMLS